MIEVTSSLCVLIVSDIGHLCNREHFSHGDGEAS